MGRLYSSLLLYGLLYLAHGQEPTVSEECQAAMQACESDLECSNRLAPLMAACTTGTCQPQCRNAVLNVYQNKLGRTLLRTDVSCIPGREELRTCNFLPTAPIVHCSLAKLACEADLQCNSQWGVFVSECEAETARGECSTRCRALLAATMATPYGEPLESCTCTEREDQLCIHLRDNILRVCDKAPTSTSTPEDNSITLATPTETHTGVVTTDSAEVIFPSLLLCALLAIRLLYML